MTARERVQERFRGEGSVFIERMNGNTLRQDLDQLLVDYDSLVQIVGRMKPENIQPPIKLVDLFHAFTHFKENLDYAVDHHHPLNLPRALRDGALAEFRDSLESIGFPTIIIDWEI